MSPEMPKAVGDDSGANEGLQSHVSDAHAQIAAPLCKSAPPLLDGDGTRAHALISATHE